MASKKVNIQIDTRANTSGAKQVEVAVDKMVDSVDEAEAAVVDLSVAVDKLDTKLIDVDRSATEVERAVDKLDTTLDVAQSTGKETAQSIEAVAQASDKAAVASKKQEAGTSRVGQVASQAGFQLQDFAVQVAGGTSALTAMAQQAPQFLGVFGPGGAIAGALIAVGAVATKVFMSMRDDSAATAAQAEILADAIEQIGDNAAKAVARDIDFGLAQIDAATEQAQELIGAFDDITDASNAATLASLSNAEKIRQAEIEIRKLRGEQVDEIANITAATEAEAAARAELGRQEIEAQRKRLADAQQAEEIAQQAFLAKQSEKTQAELALQAETRKLELLRAQRDELEKQAKERGKFSEGEIPFMATGQAQAAQRQLEDPAFQALIAATEARVNALDEQLREQGGKLTEAVTEASQALESAMTNTAAVAETIAIEIPRIEETLQAESVKAQVSGLAEIGQQAAKDIDALVENVKPENTGQAAALESLKQATADGQITANETAKVAAALQTLNGLMGTSMTSSNANVQALIQAVTTLNQRTLDQKRQIDSLNARIRSGN